MECHQGWSSLLDVLVGMFLVIYLVVRDRPMHCHQVISIQEIITEDINHMQEIREDTTTIVAMHIHHILLLHHQVMGDMGNPHRTLGEIVGPTSLHHMQRLSSGSSNNLIVPILEVGRLLQGLIHDHSSPKTAMAPQIGIQTGDHQVRAATRPASSLVLALVLLLLTRTYFGAKSGIRIDTSFAKSGDLQGS